MKDLKKKTAEGVIWKGGSQTVNEIIRFSVSVTLARLLFPHDFGTMAMAAIFIEIVSAFNDLGMGAAIIKIKDLKKEHLSTAFWSNLVVGIILCLLGILAAPLMARYFGNENLKPVVEVLSFGFIIGSLSMVHSVQMTRKLDFKTNGIIRVGGTLISGFIAIPMINPKDKTSP